ncbi:MAG: EFR1 family ferrodoxin [Oscillospiraceae bacterium]|nr:EFR1 family ferrodoxin [Oscillospiraceae bacterium]
MLTLYFSGTGNTEFIAKLFSARMEAECLSIEENMDAADFSERISVHDTLAFCYPIYCSRVPRNMREFTAAHKDFINGKKVIILVTQMFFSGDGARVFTDLFEDGAIEVIYAEHFNMPLNMGNVAILNPWKPSDRSIRKSLERAKIKMARICGDINKGIVKKRGFAKGSELLGFIQGKPWQKDTESIHAQRGEKRGQVGVKVFDNCNACNLCTRICPMNNLVNDGGKIIQQGNCAVCYRCVNHCPQKAVTVLIPCRPKWQYKGPYEGSC